MDIEDFLSQADKLCELIWSIYFKLHVIYMVSVTIAPAASIISCWLIYGHFDVDHLFHILNMRSVSAAFIYRIKNFRNELVWIEKKIMHFSSPWDKTTMLGYFGEIVQTWIAAEIYLIVNGVALVLFISICIHHRAFYKIFKHSIHEWNSCQKNQNHDEDRGSIFVRDLIHFHILVKR